jgi:hypothetical protein
MGLGPTPQDVGTPGLKCYAPTRLQMEIFARMKAESDKAALEQQVLELRPKWSKRHKADQVKSLCHNMIPHAVNLWYNILLFSYTKQHLSTHN